MPYAWTTPTDLTPPPEWRLSLWPNRSLSPTGFAVFIASTCAMFLFPLFAVLGTVHLWVLLPFPAAAVALVWYFLRRSTRDGQMREDLSLWHDKLELIRQNPRGTPQTWQANPYWVRLDIHEKGGPVANYLTLSGGGREVELGAFLSPEERIEIYRRLSDTLRHLDTNRD